MSEEVALGVIIPAFNAERTLARALEPLAVAASDLDLAGRWEVVIADNGSTDGTISVASHFSSLLPIRVVDASQRRGPAAARNAGARATLARVLVFTDADDVVDARWLHAWFTWAVGADDRALAAGPIWLAQTPLPAELVCRVPTHMGLPYTPGSNCGISRELFEELGGFDEDRQTGEDVDLAWKALEAGLEIGCVPGVVLVRPERSTLRTVRRYFQYGLGDVALYRDHEELHPSRSGPGVVVRTYAGVLLRTILLWQPGHRRRWAHQLGRRAGRLVGSIRYRTWFP